MRYSMLITGICAVLMAGGCSFGNHKPDGSGTIECTQVQVAPQVGGRIATLPPQEGAALKKGDLVAQLDTADYELKVVAAKATLDLELAQLDLMRAGSRDEDIQRAKAQTDEAQAAATVAAADMMRIRAVFEKGSATRKQMDDATAGRDRTAAVLAAAQQNLAKVAKGNRQEDIKIAEARFEQAKAGHAQALKALSDCTVMAPMDGVVTTRSREEGEVVNAGTTLITLSRLDEVWLAVYVPEPLIARVRLGQPAKVKVDGDKTFYQGVVTFVSPEAEFTPKNVQTRDERAKLVYKIKVTLKNPDGVFKPGMPADAFLEN